MSSHAVTHDAYPLLIQLGKLCEERIRELVADVAIHSVPLAPGLLGSVDIEPRPGAKIPRGIFVLNL